MKVIIAGSTGMVGQLVLKTCIGSENIDKVVSIVRKPSGTSHHKLSEVVIENLEDYANHGHLFKNVDGAFFCIGVYTGQVPDAEFRKITVNYAVAFAEKLKLESPEATLCLLSGAGADRTERSRTSFARYKGMAENQISTLELKFHSFRPAYIYPDVPRKEPNIGYSILRVFYPLLKLFGKKYSIQSVQLAEAMVNVAMNGADKEILENDDILRYAK
ncbi:epimerase [Sphingobacterium siyangense subsp. cladoniae]|uniref:hypothetical protein n=1 Tax=Sphingobacterium siyangense TaxID=459529 RepID=UPI0031F806D7